MAEIRFGGARVPSRESPEEAIAILEERGYTACEIDFEGKFWMDYDWAERFGELAREHGIALSVHAPIAGFMGHAERGKKLNMAVGMLDHSAGISKAVGAEVVVFHPGFLLGRTREEAIDSVVEQLGELRERLEKKERGHGTRPRARLDRRRARDLLTRVVGATRSRLRAHARDERRRVHFRGAVRRRP
jgi:deoxyribonuclease-4